MYRFTSDAAKALPPNIRFGTSSWTYRDWKTLVYHREYKNEKEFTRESLAEYSAFGAFRTVGIDSSFYVPPKIETLEYYSSVTPPDFKWVSKVWEFITAPVFASHPRYGKRAGQKNPDFLSNAKFEDEVLSKYSSLLVRERTGPFLFQFPHIDTILLSSSQFFERLQLFLEQLPKDFRYAVEVRNVEYLTPQYFSLLNDCGVTHCFNNWAFMPSLLNQMKRAAEGGGILAPFLVARLLTPSGMSHGDAEKRFPPFDSIKRVDEEMRKSAVKMVKRAIDRGSELFLIVGNTAEGCSPLTVQSIQELAIEELGLGLETQQAIND